MCRIDDFRYNNKSGDVTLVDINLSSGRCDSTTCLQLTNMCDGKVDCMDESDETNCCKSPCIVNIFVVHMLRECNLNQTASKCSSVPAFIDVINIIVAVNQRN